MGETYHLKAGDTTPRLDATLLDSDDEPVDLSGVSVVLELLEPRGGDVALESAMDVVDPESGTVRYDWGLNDTDDPGRYRAHFVVTYPDDSIETFPTDDYHDVLIHQ